MRQETKFPIRCPGCSGKMNPRKVMNSLSRYGHGYICSSCGLKEAFKGDFINNAKEKTK